jgi:hypothetical protein
MEDVLLEEEKRSDNSYKSLLKKNVPLNFQKMPFGER